MLLRKRWVKVLVFALSLAPLAWLGWRGWNQDLSANPIEFITRYTGDWTLRFLVFTLAITPVRKLLGLPDLIKFRRMIGLFAFFYGCLHFTTYIWLDKFFDLAEMLHDVAKRPFITAGFTAFVLMIPLAITSTTGWIRRMGGKRWQMLHRLVYISAAAGVIHYYWLVKSAVQRPIFYGVLVAIALVIRATFWAAGKRARTAAKAPIPAVR
jgi:sulfoxide reductase heme-binding subunit YedZ